MEPRDFYEHPHYGGAEQITLHDHGRTLFGMAKVVEDEVGPVIVIVLPFLRKETADKVLAKLGRERG